MSTVFEARVAAAFGRYLLVRDASGREHRARPLGRKLAPVCGDDVRCRHDPQHGDVLVIEILPRRTALYRSNLRGEAEPVVANLTQLIVVLAPLPSPDYFVIDRYVAAATSAGIAAALVLNKVDLGVDDELRAELAAYERAGYRWISCSAHSGEGIDSLLDLCARNESVLVGQSGVGKSSLVRRLVPGAEVAIGELARYREGRHTTTASRLFDLPRDGQLIDSPGVRDFAPAIDCLDDSSLGFVEVERLAAGCRFADCRHMREPDCAVRAAAESGALHPRRYESYRRMRRLYEELTAAAGPGRKKSGD